ncbi:hypothetical protein [Streptomyces chryseus]
MSPVPNAAKAAAKARMVATGENYTTALRHVLDTNTTAGPQVSLLARDYLTRVLRQLEQLGWSVEDVCGPEYGHYETYVGPTAGLHILVRRSGNEVEADPDDGSAVDVAARLYLEALCPVLHATVEDFEFHGETAREPELVARRMDAALGRRRLRRARAAEPESRTPCPSCGDRYPERRLLANSPSAAPVCPACVFDQDQHYCTDVAYLAVQIDELTHEDLAAPAGWDAVAAVLALSCGKKLGRRMTQELSARGGWPILTPRWDFPLESSWIWLPPPAMRHSVVSARAPPSRPWSRPWTPTPPGPPRSEGRVPLGTGALA